MADLFDAINQNTRATGQWGKKGPPKMPSWPRPTTATDPAEKKPKTVAELHAQLSGR